MKPLIFVYSGYDSQPKNIPKVKNECGNLAINSLFKVYT